MHSKAIRSDKETLSTYRKIILRSTSYAIAAYFISIGFERVLMVAGAWLKGYNFISTYNKVSIIAEPYLWDQEAVLLIYLVPFLMQAVVAILIYVKFNKIALTPHYSRIFLLWIMFFINYRLLGMYSSHMIFESGIFHALHWMFIGLFIKILTGILTAILFTVTGLQMLRGIIIFAGTYNNHVRDMGVPRLVFASILYPIFSVCFAAALFYLPEVPYEEITGLILLIAVSLFALVKMVNVDPDLFSYKEKPAEKANPAIMLGIILISVIALRILLGLGLLSG
jgi:hypothetical protein